MKTARLEAFTDGVVAIAITIMVLELKVPHDASWGAFAAQAPVYLAYVLSFINIGLYWANHHHMLHAAERVDGKVLWANLFLLFWLSLVPFVIRWVDEVGFEPLPVAAYGFVMGMAAIGYTLIRLAIIALEGPGSKVALATGADRKGKLSLAGYIAAFPLAFVSPMIAIVIYVAIAAIWLIPDRRYEKRLDEEARPARPRTG